MSPTSSCPKQFSPRYTESVTFIDYKEVNSLIASFLEVSNYNLVADMGINNSEWQNDTIQQFEIGPDESGGQRPERIKVVLAKKKVEWNWELDAIMNAIAQRGDLAPGRYIVEICW